MKAEVGLQAMDMYKSTTDGTPHASTSFAAYDLSPTSPTYYSPAHTQHATSSGAVVAAYSNEDSGGGINDSSISGSLFDGVCLRFG